jgi:phosphoribosylamine--glycine ligase
MFVDAGLEHEVRVPAAAWSSNPGSRLAPVQVLVVGSGAREHALAWRLAQSGALTELHAAPGNPGIAAIGRCHPVRADDAEGLLALSQTIGVDLVVVGPEGPLVAGVADVLRHSGIAVFGPSAAAARIEGSKTFAKDVLHAAGVPTAATLSVARPPCVVKADGLAAGKGVFVCRSAAELDDALGAVRRFGGEIVIEELLDGAEVSVFAVCDGVRAVPLGAAQDFKRIRNADEGPNTGGMGAYSPVRWFPGVEAIVEEMVQPVVDELARRGSPFVGCLFAGLMVGQTGPKVLEFNARFGDPETQVLMPRFESDLLELLLSAAHGDLSGVAVATSPEAAVTVVLAGPDYPERSDYAGAAIAGVDAAEAAGALVFHGGTAARDGMLVTNGGRILSVTGTGATVADARARAYAAVSMIEFDGAQHRTDIAEAAARG